MEIVMKIKFFVSLAAVSVLFLSGCSTIAPQYSGSRENVEALQSIPSTKLSVGRFYDDHNPANNEKLNLRGLNTMSSAYGETYAGYVEQALRQDLTIADRYSSESSLMITGVLKKNNLDISSSFATGTSICEVEFSVLQNKNSIYKKTLTQSHEWESSFVGAIAIPKAKEEYTVTVQKIINKLFKDQEFIEAMKKSAQSK